MKFAPCAVEKKAYNSTNLFHKNNPMDLSLTMEQLPHLAWVEDKIEVSKLHQQEHERQSPKYLNIPDDLHPVMALNEILRNGVKLLKSNKVLTVLFFQAMYQTFTVRITCESFWNAMLSDSGSRARQQAEGFSAWRGQFDDTFFCIIFLEIFKSLDLSEKDIDMLIKLLLEGIRLTAHLCQLSYNFMGLLDLWTIDINEPHCAFFGAIGNKGSILDSDYITFQEKRSLRLQGITIDTNNTRELFQATVNQVLSTGHIIFTGSESKPICFGPTMLVTARDSEQGAIQLRDIDEVDKENCTAVVLDKCT
jgi:hypothetical protein